MAHFLPLCIFFILEISHCFVSAQSVYRGYTGTEKLNVSVYYESLCPDSKRFIIDNFWPTFKQYLSKINVRFIPFGKADINDDGTNYRCQHYERECHRNKIQACALERIESGLYRTAYLVCAMANTDLEGQEFCVNDLIKDGWRDVLECTNGEEGTKLTILAGKDTKASTPGPKFVPTILINDKYDEENQRLAFEDFGQIITKYLYN